jgi:NitT/TauT family transport system substrate-binding protein
MRLRCAAAAIVALAIFGCDPRPNPKLDPVKIADRGFLTNAPIYIAEEEGYFADERIKLVFTEPPRSSSQMIPLLERGDIDVMASSLTAGFFSAVAQGGRSRIVADRGHVSDSGCDYDGVIARRGLFEGGAPNAKDMRGKRFSVGPAGMGAYIIDKYLEAMGLTVADLTLVRLGERVEAQALDQGSIDGMHVAEPHLSMLVARGNRLIGPARVYAPGLHYAVLVFGPSLTVTHRDVGERFMRAYLRGVKKFQEGLTPRNLDIISRRTGFNVDTLRKICPPTINADGALNGASLLDFQKWLVKNGFLSRELGPEGGTDMTFARQAAKELGIAPARASH